MPRHMVTGAQQPVVLKTNNYIKGRWLTFNFTEDWYLKWLWGKGGEGRGEGRREGCTILSGLLPDPPCAVIYSVLAD